MTVPREPENISLDNCVRNLYQKIKTLWKYDMQKHHLQEQDRHRIGILLGSLIETQGDPDNQSLLDEECTKKSSLQYLALALEGFEDLAQKSLESIPISAIRLDLELQSATLRRLFS